MESSIQIEERAAAWLAKRDGESWTQADELAFASWLDASTANRVAFLRLEALWETADRLQVLGAGASAPGERQQHAFFGGEAARKPADPTPPTREYGERSAYSYRALAASLLIAAAIGTGWYAWPTGPSYRTEIGDIASVMMSDGSKVTLNTDSEIRLNISDEERHVDLEHGEVFFEVARDPSRPFVVQAGNERFIAVGTKFSVRRNGDANRLVVTEGRVRVEAAAAILAKASLPPTEVSAGGVARSGEAGVLVEEKPVAEAEMLLSWRSGYLVFKETPLAEAIAEFNRYNTRKLVIEDASVASILIGGNFRSTNVDAFVRLLEDGFPIHVKRDPDVILLSDARNVPAASAAQD